MNYEMLDDLGMIPGTGEAYWSSNAYIDNSTTMDIYNFDNYGAWASNVFTEVISNQSYRFMWGCGWKCQCLGVDGIGFNYGSHGLSGTISTTHGARVHLWFIPRMASCQLKQWGALPAPVSSLFPSHKTPFAGEKSYLGKIHSGSCWWLSGWNMQQRVSMMMVTVLKIGRPGLWPNHQSWIW